MRPPQEFRPISADALDAAGTELTIDWLWEGYLGRGQITLLTSQWKSGKTTLIAGVLRHLGSGEPFLGRAVKPGRALVISEEAPELWAGRKREIPFGSNVEFLIRPFKTRPTPGEWRGLIEFALARRAAGELDVIVVDPLTKFLPGRSDSDQATLLEFLDPLQEVAAAGAAALVLHHPRRESSEEGHGARGSGALLGYVDVILEQHRYSQLKSDARRRRIVGLSRHRATPPSLVYEWTIGTPEFTLVDDVFTIRFMENWDQVKNLLTARPRSVTARDLLDDWPENQPKPSRVTLYHWLNRATAEKLVLRGGHGTRLKPYRYRLPDASDPAAPGRRPIRDKLNEFIRQEMGL